MLVINRNLRFKLYTINYMHQVFTLKCLTHCIDWAVIPEKI